MLQLQRVAHHPTHRCFIQPELDPHLCQAALEECEEDNESDNGSDKTLPLLVYGDIETMLEEDSTFTPVLLVYRTSEDDDFHVLKGENCCKVFIRDLDDLGDLGEGHEEDERREIIILFHNLKGFDGIFILNTLHNDIRDVE